MSNNCLFTVNIHNFLTPYARRHFLAACGRWDCDYVELHHLDVPNYPSCSKLFAPAKLLGYDKILCLDADMVVSLHAPNVFDLCTEPNVLYAVGDYQAPNRCDDWRRGPYRIGTEALLQQHPTFGAPAYELFMNGGMWLCFQTPAMRAMFAAARESLPVAPVPYVEQGTINVWVHNTPGIKLCLLPETWNHIIPQNCEPIPEYYINHFGGWAHDLLKTISVAFTTPKP
jgi:hypothetical protein